VTRKRKRGRYVRKEETGRPLAMWGRSLRKNVPDGMEGPSQWPSRGEGCVKWSGEGWRGGTGEEGERKTSEVHPGLGVL